MRFALMQQRRTLHWISLALFGLVTLFLIAFGALYASVTQMLWFHAATVPEAIREDVRPLYFALMKLIGGASIALGLLGAWVLVGPMRNQMPGAAAALAITYAIPLLMAAYVAETLARLTGAPTSWHIMGVLLLLVALAYAAATLVSRTPRARMVPMIASREMRS